MVSNEVGPGAVQCGSILVNNVLVIYRSPLPGGSALAGLQFGPAKQITQRLSCDEGIMGNVEVSPATHHVFVIHDNALFNSVSVARCAAVAFGPPVPGVSDPSGLECVDLPVASLQDFRAGANFPSLAVDSKGNLYAVWQQAPINGSEQVTGDTLLMYSFSTDEGASWSKAIQIPTPGLHNNVLTSAAAGDDGRVGIAWYGTTATANPNDPCGTNKGGRGGPDSTTGAIWSVYYAETLNGHDSSGVTFTPPVVAGEHYVHKGTIRTIIGNQCGDRSVGDFLQLRIGSQGEAQIAFADSNSITGKFAGTHAMYVRQNGGTGLVASSSPVKGDPILLDTTTDRVGDGKYEAGGVTSANLPNLDIVESSLAKPAPAACHPAGTPCYRVKMTVNALSLTPPGPPDSDIDLVWLTQWFVPASPGCASGTPACDDGGKKFFVYAESTAGAEARCFSGENNVQFTSGGVTLTYPGKTQVTAPGACSLVAGPLGKITIDVPIADVSIAAPLSNRLYSVTASTMTLSGSADCCPDAFGIGIGGIPFNLIDVARGYDAVFAGTAVTSLTLAPQTATNVVGAQHCVSATVATASGAPASGVSVRFSVSGANRASGVKTSGSNGQALFCYTGANTGNDAIAAFADLNKSAAQDPGEPSDTASKTWAPRSTAGCDAKISNGGQITTDHGDTATFGGEAIGLASGAADGNETYQDHGPAEPLSAKSLAVTSIACDGNRTQASIFGQATLDGGAVASYEIDVADNGEPSSSDTYRIRLSNGYDSGRHTLSGGDVQIR
jgi:hypothetical protein